MRRTTYHFMFFMILFFSQANRSHAQGPTETPAVGVTYVATQVPAINDDWLDEIITPTPAEVVITNTPPANAGEEATSTPEATATPVEEDFVADLGWTDSVGLLFNPAILPFEIVFIAGSGFFLYRRIVNS